MLLRCTDRLDASSLPGLLFGWVTSVSHGLLQRALATTATRFIDRLLDASLSVQGCCPVAAVGGLCGGTPRRFGERRRNLNKRRSICGAMILVHEKLRGCRLAWTTVEAVQHNWRVWKRKSGAALRFCFTLFLASPSDYPV